MNLNNNLLNSFCQHFTPYDYTCSYRILHVRSKVYKEGFRDYQYRVTFRVFCHFQSYLSMPKERLAFVFRNYNYKLHFYKSIFKYNLNRTYIK